MKVRASYQFPALMHPNLFHHMSPLYCRHASGCYRTNSQQEIRDAAQNLARLKSPSSFTPSPLTDISPQSTSVLETPEHKVDAAQTELGRVLEHAANVTWRILEHRAGVLVTALATAERRHPGEGHDDGDDFLSSDLRH